MNVNDNNDNSNNANANSNNNDNSDASASPPHAEMCILYVCLQSCECDHMFVIW